MRAQSICTFYVLPTRGCNVLYLVCVQTRRESMYPKTYLITASHATSINTNLRGRRQQATYIQQDFFRQGCCRHRRMLPPSKDVAAIEKTTYGAGGVEKVWVLGSQQLSTALSEPRPIYGIRVLHEMNHIKQGTRSCLLCGVQILLKTKL